MQQRPASDFAIEEGDLEGFQPAVSRVEAKGFVSIEGLLDEAIASVIVKEMITGVRWSHRT